MTTACRGLARLAVVVASLLVYCTVCTDSATAQRLVYRVDLKHTSDHYIDVTVQPLDLRPDTMYYQMPLWTPGVYSDAHYGRFIHSFEAKDSSGDELPVKRLSDDRWRITATKAPVAEIHYRVYDSHADASGPEIAMAKFDENGVFANTEAIFGYVDNDKGIPATIFFDAPKTWSIATTLEPVTQDDLTDETRYHQFVYNSESYDELAETPLAAAPQLKTTTFREGGVDYNVIAMGGNHFDINAFAKAADGIIKAESSFFNSIPFDEYSFFVNADASQTFGLAHTASSVMSFSEAEAADPQHLIAATFFKTWNGSRFHIPQLGPVDYTAPIATRALWFNEGLSDYYAELLRVRYGLTKPAEFFNSIDNWERISSATANMPIETLSVRCVKYNDARLQALRARGAIAALLMDIEIRTRTHGHHSLDEVLLRMDHESKTGKTYDEKDLVATIAKYSHADVGDFCNRYVGACDSTPLESYLERIGAAHAIPASMQTGGETGLNLALNAAGTAIITEVPHDSLFAMLERGDTVSAIDGEKVTAEKVDTAKARLAKGAPVTLTVVHNRKQLAVHVVKATAKAKKPTTLLASRQQLAMQRALIGKRRFRRFAYAASSRGR